MVWACVKNTHKSSCKESRLDGEQLRNRGEQKKSCQVIKDLDINDVIRHD